jgi:hypothetical protein
VRSCLTVLLACLVAAVTFAEGALAHDFPTELRRHYRFLPRRSILNETGGIYPRDIDYRVFGTFDWRDTTVNPVADGFVSFDNVEAWASHPILAYVLNLNNVLGMEHLVGYQLPVMAPFDVYKFRGKSADGSAVELYASVIGPWLHLRGGTTPPPGSADFFVYHLRATARERPFADFNGDDVVASDDLARWENGFGSSTTLSNSAPLGDANDDKVVDGGDFLLWQTQLGVAPPSDAEFDAAIAAAIASEASALAVPEPGSAWLLAVGGGLMMLRRRR